MTELDPLIKANDDRKTLLGLFKLLNLHNQPSFPKLSEYFIRLEPNAAGKNAD